VIGILGNSPVTVNCGHGAFHAGFRLKIHAAS
jgi:hypothetical protein